MNKITHNLLYFEKSQISSSSFAFKTISMHLKHNIWPMYLKLSVSFVIKARNNSKVESSIAR
jgi:hypothetical protein